LILCNTRPTFPGSEYPFDSGLYLFPDEPNLDYDLVEDYKNKSKSIITSGKRKKLSN
jgi:hypothetical protein